MYFGNVHFYLKKKKMNLGFKRYIFRKRGGEVFKEFFFTYQGGYLYQNIYLDKKEGFSFLEDRYFDLKNRQIRTFFLKICA